MELKPRVKVKALGFGGDPTFESGSSRTARVQLTNPGTSSFTYSVELYLGVTKVAASGILTTDIGAGQTASVDLPVIMPSTEGTYEVYLDVSEATAGLIKHYKAAENVTIAITPRIVVGPITWV